MAPPTVADSAPPFLVSASFSAPSRSPRVYAGSAGSPKVEVKESKPRGRQARQRDSEAQTEKAALQRIGLQPPLPAVSLPQHGSRLRLGLSPQVQRDLCPTFRAIRVD